MARDKVDDLYDNLKEDGWVENSREHFRAYFLAPGEQGYKNRKALYDNMKEDGYVDSPTYEEFARRMGLRAVQPSKPQVQAPAQTTTYYKLRRGGADFTVSADDIKAAGGLSGWAKAHPGAPVRVYMQGKKDDGTNFDGHVDLSVAHARRKNNGYKYTTVSKPIQQSKPQSTEKPWKPTQMQQMAMSHQLQQMQEDTNAMMDSFRERSDNMTEYARSSQSLGFQPVKSKMVWNRRTKKFEQSYLTPTGERTTSKTAAEMASRQYRKALSDADMSVGAQIRRTEAELAELRQNLNESASRVHDEWAEDYKKNKAPLAAVLAADTYVPRQISDKENSALRVAIRQKEEQLRKLRDERDRQIGKDVGFWRGFGQTVSDSRTWDFGMGDIMDAMTMMNAKEYSSPNATNGEKRAGQKMMKAVYDNEQTEQMYGGNASFWNRAGVMTGYMPSFMVDFAITGGGFEALDVAGKAAARGSVKLLGKEAVKEMAELGVKAYAKKYGIKGVGRMAGNWTIKALGTTADDLLIRAPLMTNTVQAGKTAADIIDRKLGDVVIDENGNYDFSNDKTWGSAIWQGEANAIIENYSEMFGTHLDGVAPALAKTFGGKRISGMLARANASNYGKILSTTRKQFQRLGVSDYFGEVSEEYYGQLWRTMLNLDDAYRQNIDGSRTNLFFDGQFHGDIWGGMALSMGLMGAGRYTLSGAAYGNMKHQVNKADRQAAQIFTPNRWEPIREIIDNTTNEDMGDLAERMINDTNLSDEERSAVMGYMERSLNLRGLNLGAMAKSRGNEADENEQAISESYIDGYEAQTSQEMTDAQNMYNVQRHRIEGIFEADDIAELESNPVAALREMANNELYTEEEVDVARDYINAKTVVDGMKQRLSDSVDEQIAQSDAEITARINKKTGMILPAVLNGVNDRSVYIVDGNIVLNEDGTIYREASDNTLIVRDAQTGEVEFSDSKQIVSVGEVIDPQEERATAVDNIRQQAERFADEAMNGTLAMNPGDVVIIKDSTGVHPVTIVDHAIDENGQQTSDIVVQFENGTKYDIEAATLQKLADDANLERVNQFEQERQSTRQEQRMENDLPKFALNDVFTVIGQNGEDIQGTITGELNEDGLIEVTTDEPVNGNIVNQFTPEDFMGIVDTYNGNVIEQSKEEVPATVPETTENVPTSAETGENPPISVPNSTENGNNGGVIIPTDGNIGAENIPANAVAPQNEAEQPQAVEPTPLQRIPRDEKGEPIFEQADSPETAWDALVEFSEGDAATAKEIADTMAEEKRKAFEKAQKQKPKGKTPTEILASKKANSAELAKAESEYLHWQKMANVEQNRQNAIRSQQEAEARQRAAERAEAEKAEREAREEAARLEREALEGIPEWHMDTPENARKRGARRYGGQMFTRQEPIQNVPGKEVEVKFSQKDLPKGRVAVIEAEQLQPSHIQGQRNPMFFIEEAQPKNRSEAVSMNAARDMAEGIRPQEITGSATAYTGAPTVNTRGEVIQGNNRSDALRYLWQNNLPEQQQTYKQYILDNAEQFGLDTDAVGVMQHPVLVNMLDVDDADAIRLGQMTAQDTESGGIERIKPKNVAQKLGDGMRSFATRLLSSGDDEATFGQLVDRNGTEVLKWMNQVGAISNTQFQSAFDSKGNLTAEAKNDLQKVLYQAVFKGGSQQLEEMFDRLPAKAQRAILSTAFRDMDSPFAGKMLPEIQSSIIAYNELMQDPAFESAKNLDEALRAVEAFKRQISLDDRFEQYMPADNFSNFALQLAAMYKASDMSQTTIASCFNQMYDLAQGKKAATLFEEADTTEYPLAEVIKQVLGIDYKPAKNGNNNVTDGGADVALRNQVGQGGELRGNEPPANGEQTPTGTEPSERGAGTEDDSPAEGGRGDVQPVEERRESEEAEVDENGNLFVKADNGTTIFGEITEDTGLPSAPIKLSEGTVDKDGNGYGLLHIEARHGDQIRKAGFASVEGFVQYVANNYDKDNIKVGKRRVNGSGTFIIQIEDEHSNLLYIELSRDGSYWNVNSGGVFRKGYAEKKKNVEPASELPTSDTASSDKSFVQTDFGNGSKSADTHSDNQRISESKDNTSLPNEQISEEKIATQHADVEGEQTLQASIEAAASEVNTEPTPAQAEAGNYKKGHITIGEFDITIENPAGSVRKGVDADGKEWQTTMSNTYGYIKGTEGVDGDHIDVFLHSDMDQWDGRKAFVVDQTNTDGSFDEHKVMLGFNDKDEAMSAYLANYDADWAQTHPGLRISETNIEDFNKWVESSHRKTKPFADYSTVSKVTDDAPVQDYGRYQNVWDSYQKAIADKQIPDVKRIKAELAKAKKRLRTLEQGAATGISSDDMLSRHDEAVNDTSDAIRAYEAVLADIDRRLSESQSESNSDGYIIDNYTTKKGKEYVRVVFPRADKTVWQERLNLAKKMGGTSVPKGYGFKTRVEAEAFAEAVLNPDTMNDAQPLSLNDIRDASGVSKVDVGGLFDTLNSKGETKLSDHTEAIADKKPPVNPSGNRLVTDERYAELRERMRKKLGGQLNMGVDPEILAIGTEMAVYHIEKGARKFTEYAKAMIADLGNAIRPYLKSFYNAVRDMPEAVTAGLVDDMDGYEDVRKVDIANFDKPTVDAFATAEAVTREQEVEKEKAEAEKKLKDKRKEKKSRPKPPEADSNPPKYSGEVTLKDGRKAVIIYVTRTGNIVPGYGSSPGVLEYHGQTRDGKLVTFSEDDVLEEPAVTVEPNLFGDSEQYQQREEQTAQLVSEISGSIMERALADWKRRVCLTPSGTRDLTPRAK